MLLKCRNSRNEEVAEAAADGLAILSGVTNPRAFVFERLEAHGFDGLTDPQQKYFAVAIYDGEVNNGGHTQYVFNSSGDLCETALSGLRAIGASKRAEMLSEALELFGRKGASNDTGERHEQLAAFSGRQDTKLDALNSRYYECEENIEVLLTNYAVEHKEDFSERK